MQLLQKYKNSWVICHQHLQINKSSFRKQSFQNLDRIHIYCNSKLWDSLKRASQNFFTQLLFVQNHSKEPILQTYFFAFWLNSVFDFNARVLVLSQIGSQYCNILLWWLCIPWNASLMHYISKDSSFHLSSNISQSTAAYSQLQFLLSSLATMCVALISLFTCNSFRDLHQLRTTYGGPDLQSFYFVPWKPTRNNFLFEYWVFTEVLLFTRDSGLWNHILQESHPKNLTVTFINSSLFQCSQGSWGATEHHFSSLRACWLLLLFTIKKK